LLFLPERCTLAHVRCNACSGDTKRQEGASQRSFEAQATAGCGYSERRGESQHLDTAGTSFLSGSGSPWARSSSSRDGERRVWSPLPSGSPRRLEKSRLKFHSETSRSLLNHHAQSRCIPRALAGNRDEDFCASAHWHRTCANHRTAAPRIVIPVPILRDLPDAASKGAATNTRRKRTPCAQL